MDEGIDYKPNGEIHIRFDDKQIALRRPKLRDYRWLSEQLQGLGSRITQVSDKIAELEAQLADDDADTDALQAEIDNLNQPIWDYVVPMIREIAVRVGDGSLPDDADDWPPWLALNATLPGQILLHWRQVPKAPGAAGTN